MTPPAILIAGREFRAYVATASFWVALAVGPLAVGGAMALSAAGGPPRPAPITVQSQDPVLATSAMAALVEAGRLEGRRYGPATGAATTASLRLRRSPDNGVTAQFSANFPLSLTGQALVERTIERDLLAQRLPSRGVVDPGPRVREVRVPTKTPVDAGALSRFCLVMMLWLTLTGSLGMLLQAVVRERANRALEGLLASARPWEIVLGKLSGVGAVSFLVLAAWLGSAAALAGLTPGGSGVMAAVVTTLAAPAALIRTALLYVLAFAFYGLVTVALGASARDSAAAQNLARPMFAVLLAAFFAALAAVSGAAGSLSWLVYAPPFAPFMMLLTPPTALAANTQIVATLLMIAAIAVAGRVAIARVTLSGAVERSPPRRARPADV